MLMPARSLSDSVLPTSALLRRDIIENISDQASQDLNALTLTSDEESLVLLARLRMGETWSIIVEDISSMQSTVDLGIQLEDARELDSASSQPSTLSTEHTGVLYSRTHENVPGERTTDLPCSQQRTPFARTVALVVAKPWLTEIFDRQYFRQVGYIYHTPRTDPSLETLCRTSNHSPSSNERDDSLGLVIATVPPAHHADNQVASIIEQGQDDKTHNEFWPAWMYPSASKIKV